ncbi:MAG: 16S rRNA (cytidine(1402)-2'-O)-methyltransferase, partial [SAR202 cluster bacterium]|nr:16S rRNA (cytidine(1402)-2'-O)-methyltransferase [SAR202 cluster bacterium]
SLPSLYIVGTPIGNLEDLTFRAKNILSEIGYIFSEDTRVTKKLLDRYDIKSKLISIYQPNKNLNTSSFINILETNDVAFVTDAGTPGISDPAGEFVKLARNNNHQIITIPGVSALTSAFSVSGFESKGLNFLGFLPKSLNQKINILNKAVELLFPIVIYESPKRIIETLEFLKKEFRVEKIFVAKELTKIYENIFYGKIDDAIKEFSNKKGEFVLIFYPEKSKYSNSLMEKYDKILSDGYRKGVKGKKLLQLIADLSGINKSIIYDRWLDIKEKNEE